MNKLKAAMMRVKSPETLIAEAEGGEFAVLCESAPSMVDSHDPAVWPEYRRRLHHGVDQPMVVTHAVRVRVLGGIHDRCAP